ncbi:hypothetical protein [Pelagibacterium luteolum]|uniref:Uncharacterized protein n=1 Tax=Pelagibacterium luteolum TaxID=440168 RepID=A0A1G7TI11_9HYPH|nr:hypothetical protein [Pelagibacterium luteolum]SDG34831.1 hypothetical protein SAMN04487974_102136 [Pelagibacterium luteolum]
MRIDVSHELIEDDDEIQDIAFVLQSVVEAALNEMDADSIRRLVETTIEADGLELN